MKVTVYNIKGGVGKTDIALNLALSMNYGIITNEIFSPIEKVLEKERFIKLEQKEKLNIIPDEYNIIFDFGGFLDERAISALKQSQCVVVPTIDEVKDIQTTIDFIQEIEGYNKNIIIVINKTSQANFNETKKIFESNYPNYPVLRIKYSRALPNMVNEKKSIADMVKQGGLQGYSYKEIAEQFEALIKTIETIK